VQHQRRGAALQSKTKPQLNSDDFIVFFLLLLLLLLLLWPWHFSPTLVSHCLHQWAAV
jgi:hypothetical protein